MLPPRCHCFNCRNPAVTNQTARSHFMKSSRSVTSSPPVLSSVRGSLAQAETPLLQAAEVSRFTFTLKTDKFSNLSHFYRLFLSYLTCALTAGVYMCLQGGNLDEVALLGEQLPDEPERMSHVAVINISCPSGNRPAVTIRLFFPGKKNKKGFSAVCGPCCDENVVQF